MTEDEARSAVVGLLTAVRESPELASNYIGGMLPPLEPGDVHGAVQGLTAMIAWLLTLVNGLRDVPEVGPYVEFVIRELAFLDLSGAQ